MLTVGVLYDEAYGVAIKNEIEEQLKRKVSVGAMQSALRRMEKKGYLSSREGEVTSNRGGRPKRYFQYHGFGQKGFGVFAGIYGMICGNGFPIRRSMCR